MTSALEPAALELGIGIILGALLTGLVFIGVNLWRSKTTFTSGESAKTKKLAQQILNEINIPSLIIDETITPVFANTPARELDGQTDLYARITNPEVQTRIINTFSNDKSRVLYTNDKVFRLHIFPLDQQHVILMAHDVSEEGRLINMRRDFITNMSHELKTPIAAIGLLVSAIAKASGDQAMVDRFTKKLEDESKRLDALSRDVIKLSEAQSPLTVDELENVTAATVNLAQLIAKEVAAHEEFANQNGVVVRVENKKPRKGAAVMGRASAIRSAIANLLTNAITYSPEGGTVTVSLTTKTDFCVIKVSDHGPGIAQEYQNRIFERFFTIDQSRNRKLGGTGLGLSIVRNAARTHGGDVTVISEVGKGSTFEMRLPRKQKRRQHKIVARE